MRSSGQARKMAPMRKAARAQSQGMRNSGTMNIEKPVAMPAGGMRIFLRVTGVWPSRMRQRMTAMAPKAEVTA